VVSEKNKAIPLSELESPDQLSDPLEEILKQADKKQPKSRTLGALAEDEAEEDLIDEEEVVLLEIDLKSNKGNKTTKSTKDKSKSGNKPPTPLEAQQYPQTPPRKRKR
jgi:hypothetical protein